MINPFNLSEEKIRELLKGYEAWLQSDVKEMEYPAFFRKQSDIIKEEFLNKEILENINDDELYDRLYRYSRKLEGKAYRTISTDTLKRAIDKLKHNLMFIITSNESPFIIAEKLIDGKDKISNFAKAFWSPILQAQFPEILPNWNNKTENCLKVLGLDLSKGRLSTSEKYLRISEAFIYLSRLNSKFDFYSINHLMHYVIAIKEGVEMVKKLQSNTSIDPIAIMINSYKKHLRQNRLSDELYKWKLIKKYKGRPNMEAPDFFNEVTTIDFGNLIFYNARRVRDHIASEQPDAFRSCFQKLFNDNEDITKRVNEFMADVMEVYRRLEDEAGHHHDERTIGAYLTFYNPERYTIFKDSFYKSYCRMIGVEPNKKGAKYAHYMELVNRLVDNYILKDEDLIGLARGYMDSDCYEDPNHLILAQDILFQMLEKVSTEQRTVSEEEVPDFDITEKKWDHASLNTILYGPPGTGKTYHTIDLAVSIAAPDRYEVDDHISNKRVYDELVKEGLIVFTTFHQSLCYEDFIEGIKPVTDENPSLSYSVEDGIFKKIANNAAFEFVSEKSSDASKSLGFSYAYDQLLDDVTEKIGVGGGFSLGLKSGSVIEIVEITTGSNFLVQHKNGRRTYTVSRKRLEKLFSELPELSKLTNINEEIRKIIGGSNSSAYWAVLKKLRSYKAEETQAILQKKFAYEDKVAAVEKLQSDDFSISGNERTYVLIIDEINRGNVSQIFGELITLLEEDKRFGRDEGLTCLLPYSRSRFFVPPNLFIIGTMNTADRSVEALDTALRRRFCFREMMPLYDLEGLDKEFAGTPLAELLKTMNRRIEKLIDRDHQIGHSYLLNIETIEALMRVFGNKIIPLLQEYFYGNYEKMRLVIGSGFVLKLDDETIQFAVSDSDYQEYSEKLIYHINKQALENNSEFELALKGLMNS